MAGRQDRLLYLLLYLLLYNIPQAIRPTLAETVHPIYDVLNVFDTLHSKHNIDIKEYDHDSRIKDLSDQFLAIQFPNLSRSCVRRALSNFIPLCLNKNGIEAVTDSKRVQTAIGLSICEFEASGLDQLIPYECLNFESGQFDDDDDDGTESVMQCFISRLELRGEWWSTYTGYYQRLDDLCLSYALPFQKDEMIDVFVNVTKFMATVNEFWGTKIDEVTMRVDKEMEDHLRRVEEITLKIWQDLENGDEAIRRQVVKFGEELNEMLNVSGSQLDSLLTHRVDDVTQKFDSILANLETLQNNGIESLEVSLRENAISLVGAQNDVLENELNRIAHTLAIFTESQLDTLEVLKDFSFVARNLIDDELIPQLDDLRDTVFTNWLSMSDIISKEMKLWNEQVFQNFHMVSERLNCTLEQVNALETQVSNIMGIFQWISSLFTGSILNLKYFLVVLLMGCLIYLNSSSIANFIAKPSIIIIAIYIGKLLGSYIRGITS